MNEFQCSMCGGIMGADETAIFSLDDGLYGHIACMREPVTVEELVDD